MWGEYTTTGRRETSKLPNLVEPPGIEPFRELWSCQVLVTYLH